MTPSALRSLHELLIELFKIDDLILMFGRDFDDTSLIDGRAILQSLPEKVPQRKFVWLLIEELERRGHLSHAAQRGHLAEVLRRERPAWSERINQVFALVSAQVGRGTPDAIRLVSHALKGWHVYRPALMDELHKRLERSGFVAVIGPKGIGKTEVCVEYVCARRWGSASDEEPAQATLWVDASDVHTHSDLVIKLSASLNLPNEHDSTVEKHIKYLLQYLQDQRPDLLIVMDGVQEEIAPEAAALLEELSGLGVWLLLSARTAPEALSLPIIDVPNLTIPESTALLEKLYHRLQPELGLAELREVDRKTLSQVGEALMGHPGCLVQAGNHLGRVAPRDMLTRVQRFKGDYEGALEHVWRDELGEDERAFALLLAASPCGLQLCDVDECLGASYDRDTLDILHELRRRSWVRPTLLSRGQGTYYRYTLMAAARPLVERLVGSVPFALAQGRVCDVLVRRAQTLARDLHEVGWEEALDEFDLRVPDLKILLKALISRDINSAAALILALDRVLVLRGLVFERLDLYNAVMDGALEQVSDDLSAWLYLGRAMVFDRRRDREMCLSNIEHAKMIGARTTVPVTTFARVLIHWIEMTYRYVGVVEAQRRMEEVRAVVIRSGDEGLMMLLRYIAASMEITSGEMDHAELELSAVLTYRRQRGDRIRETYVMDYLIMLDRLRGRLKIALDYVEVRLRIEQVIGRRGQQVDLGWYRSSLLFELWKDNEALVELDSAYQIAISVRDVRRQGHCLLLRAFILQNLEDMQRARSDYLAAIELFCDAGFASEYVSAASYYLLWCMQVGQPNAAEATEVLVTGMMTEGKVQPVVKAFFYDVMVVKSVLGRDLDGAVLWARRSGDLYREMSVFTAHFVYQSIVNHLIKLCEVSSIKIEPPLHLVGEEWGEGERTRVGVLVGRILGVGRCEYVPR